MPENPRIEELRRRVHADPASIAFAGLAEEFRRVGRYDEAIETCRVGLQRHPAYLSARVTLGRALIETGDFEGAREELETVLRSAPENLAAIRGLAQIHERLGHSTEMDPHLAALADDIPSSAPPVAPPPPPPTRAAAPNFDLDLNVIFPAPRAAESASQFPPDDRLSALARPAVPEYEGFENAFPPSTAESQPVVPSPESFGFATPMTLSEDAPAPDAFNSAVSESALQDSGAPAHDVFDMAVSEPVVLDPAAPAHDVFDRAASEPVAADPAAPARDGFDMAVSGPLLVDAAAPSGVFDRAASEPAPIDTASLESGLLDAVVPELAPPAGDVPLTRDVPVTAADPSARRSPDFDLGLTFTLPPALAPQREAATDVSFADSAADAPDVPAIESIPERLLSFEARPPAYEVSNADSLEDDAPALRTHEPPPDPNRTATLQRLEGFLAAIQGSRVQGFTGSDGPGLGR